MAKEAEEFCKDYLVVDAKEASLLDIVSIMICSTDFLNKRKFYNERSENVEKSSIRHNLRRRLIIFASVVLRKIFYLVRKPVAFVGSLFETCLNLSSNNGGFFGLIINLLEGKVVKPEKSSAKFMSAIGHLDRRLKLDARIRKGDGRYNPALAVMAAKFAYENEAFVKAAVQDHLKMVFIGFYNFWNDYQNKFTTQASMFQDASDPNLIVVAFRGTSAFNPDDWITDFDISWYELKYTNNSDQSIGRVHAGFMKALGLQKIKGWPKELESPQNSNDQKPFAYYKIREKLKEILGKNPNAKFMVTGHSLGAALAILFVAVLGLHEEKWLLKRLEGVYTFAQPRVGDEGFGTHMMKMIEDYDLKYSRYVYSNDMIARLPLDDKTLHFKHFGVALYFNSFYGGKVLKEVPNKNYLSLVWFIPRHLNSIWELIRSFILPYWKGKEYKEDTVEKLFRVIGLIVPGITEHGPKDYVDITRLGPNLIPTIER